MRGIYEMRIEFARKILTEQIEGCQYVPVRLLEPGAGSATSELLGLAAAGVSDQQSAVEVHQNLFLEKRCRVQPMTS